MPPRYRRPERLPPVKLARRFRAQLAARLDQAGHIGWFTRGDGREVVRLSLPNLTVPLAEEFRATLGVGAVVRCRVGRTLPPAFEPATWVVEGRWACLCVLESVLADLVETGPLVAWVVLLRMGWRPPERDTCQVPGCDRPPLARKLCRAHYRATGPLGLRESYPQPVTAGCPVCGGPPPGFLGFPHLCESCRVALVALPLSAGASRLKARGQP